MRISTRSVYEVVAGFDLAFLYGRVSEEANEKIETEAHELVNKLSAFRNTLKKGGGFAETFCVKFDDFVKSPSAALRFNFVAAAHA